MIKILNDKKYTKELLVISSVEDYLLPEGFKEFIDFMNSKESNIFKAKDVQKGLSYQYGFSSGKISGILNRAEEKNLISRIGRGVYQYDGKKSKTTSAKKTVMVSTEVQSIQDKINQEIMQTVKKINEILAPEISHLSTEEFEKAKDTINKLIQLTKK